MEKLNVIRKGKKKVIIYRGKEFELIEPEEKPVEITKIKKTK